MGSSTTAGSRGGRSALVAGVTVACVYLALFAGSASATLSYSSPQTLSDPSARAFQPSLAIDGSDRTTVVWQRPDDSGVWRVQAVRLRPDGTPEPVQTLSEPGQDAGDAHVAIDHLGRATIAWNSEGRVQSSRLGPDGTPGPVQTLSEAGRIANFIHLVVDDSGSATIIWQRTNDAQIQSIRLAPDGTPGFVQTLSEIGAFDPQIAVDSVGRATVVWSRWDGQGDHVESVRLTPDGIPGAVQTLSEPGFSYARGPQVAIDGSDRATIVWHRLGDPIQSVRLAPDGTPGQVQTLSGASDDGFAFAPQVVVDGSDRATVTWVGSEEGSGSRIRSVRLRSDGSAEAVQTLSDPAERVGTPELVVDGADRATVVWYSGAVDDPFGNENSVRSVRLGADGVPQAIQTVSGSPENLFPKIVIDGSDRATIVWEHRERNPFSESIQAVRAEITFPETTITAGPAGPADDATPSFAFVSDQQESTFECSLDAGLFTPCASPEILSGLADGSHSFAVRAIDAESDVDPTPAERSFTLARGVDGSADADTSQPQRGNRVVIEVRVAAGEDLLARAAGEVEVGSDDFELRPNTKRVRAGKSRRLQLRLRRRADARTVVAALKRGRAAIGRIRVRLSDETGNMQTENLSVRLDR